MIELDALFLSRIQFGFTTAFHILFPVLTIGLASFLAIVEGLWLKTGQAIYRTLYHFWAKVFALAFGIGVVTGVVLSFQFGMNFSGFSQSTGNVLGPLIAYEVMTAFFLEAGFLGIMLFGWERVGNKLHFMATCFVAIGTIVSSFWILSANSWMHTPQGAILQGGVFFAQSWWDIVFNPSFPYRLIHMVFASFVTTSFVLAGFSAWYLLTKTHVDMAKKTLSIAMWGALIFAPLQVVVGDMHGLNTKEYQPMKVAAMEGLWETQTQAPLVLFAWPNQKEQRNDYALEIPGGASLVLTHDFNGQVKGLNEVPLVDQPYVPIVFWAFRIMVGIGLFFVALALWSGFLRWRGKMHDTRTFLWGCVFAAPLGFLATVSGWVVTEVGRQPWVVHELLRTSESVSNIAASSVATSFTLFFIIYHLILFAFLFFLYRVLAKGPTPYEDQEPTLRQVGSV